MPPFRWVITSFTCPGSIRQTSRSWNVFVIDFAHHTVFDYAPGSAHTESAAAVTIVYRSQSRYPDRL